MYRRVYVAFARVYISPPRNESYEREPNVGYHMSTQHSYYKMGRHK